MEKDRLENGREYYNMARLTNEELKKLRELELSMSEETGEAIVLIAYEQEDEVK